MIQITLFSKTWIDSKVIDCFLPFRVICILLWTANIMIFLFRNDIVLCFWQKS